MIGKKQPKKIGDIVENYLRYNGYGDVIVKNRVEERWESIAGKKIAEISKVDDYIDKKL